MLDFQQVFMPNGKAPAALSMGLCAFMLILFFVNEFYNINEKFTMAPESLFSFDLGRISMYPLVHMSFAHIFFNTLGLFPLLCMFEANHGTIYTGVILNISAVICGVFYCILGKFFYPNVSVGGASGWCFTFFAYYAVKESAASHILNEANDQAPFLGIKHSLPTLLSPIFSLVAIAFLIPGSSFWGHFFGMLFGYLMGFKENWIEKITPPSWIISKIEKWLNFLIVLIRKIIIVTYYKEDEVTRGGEYISYANIEDVDLPLHNSDLR